jgi:putative transposase
MPRLVTSDGVPGLIKAISECFPESKRQRCTFHKLQNFRNKLPQEVLDELYLGIRSVYYQINAEIARMRAAKIIDKYADTYPSAIKCFQEDFEACIQHMAFPPGHHNHIMTTNLLERAFVEQKRRTKIIPRFFDEKSCLKSVYATMVRARVKMSDFDLALLRNIRKLYNWKENEDGFISKKPAA